MHHLKKYYFNILSYDLLNKYYYNESLNLPRITELKICMICLEKDIQAILSASLLLKLISLKTCRIILVSKKKRKKKGKKRVSSPRRLKCYVTLRNTCLTKFLDKFISMGFVVDQLPEDIENLYVQNNSTTLIKIKRFSIFSILKLNFNTFKNVKTIEAYLIFSPSKKITFSEQKYLLQSYKLI